MKRQNINLYHAEFRREQSWLTLRVAGWASAAVLALTVLLSVQAQLELDYVRSEEARYQSQLAMISSELAQLKKAMGKQGIREETLARITKTRAELQANENIMTMLGMGGETAFKGFSPYMAALARQHVKGLWITDFRVSETDQELIMMGKMRQAELLPSYLQRLSGEAAFSGREFHAFRITESADSGGTVLDFVVSTRERVPPIAELLAADN